jgi:hypothetical protein
MKKVRIFLALALALFAAPDRVRAEPIVGLTTANQLFTFDSSTPGTISPFVTVTGLLQGTTLLGIDFRPANPGQLVGVGRVGGIGSVYVINPSTGAATPINTGFLLTGTAFGVDFNPVADALRITNSSAQSNLRITAGGAGTVFTDTPLTTSGFPFSPQVIGSAYSNNVAGATSTTLFDIDTDGDTLVTQGSPGGAPVSPNTGILFAVGPLNPGFDVDDNLVGFDISGASGVAYAALSPFAAPGVELGSSLFRINLATGQATLVGPIGDGNLPVLDISVGPLQESPSAVIPEPSGLVLVGLSALGLLTCFRRAGPSRPK